MLKNPAGNSPAGKVWQPADDDGYEQMFRI